MRGFHFAISVALFAQALLFGQVTVPFVGCKGYRQIAPLEAPKGTDVVVLMSPNDARKLAYYKAEVGSGILAPRGWYCFGTYGSGGGTLFVSPRPIDTTSLFSPGDDWGFAGSVIELAESDGNSGPGRYEVARVVARVFPAWRAIADSLRHNFPTADLPSGRYPGDGLTYKGNSVVEFITPARTQGLGTGWALEPSDSPIRGVAILVGPDLLQVSARLPDELKALAPVIIQQVERAASLVPILPLPSPPSR